MIMFSSVAIALGDPCSVSPRERKTVELFIKIDY